MPRCNYKELWFTLPSRKGLLTRGAIEKHLADSDIKLANVNILDLGVGWKVVFQNDIDYQAALVDVYRKFQ